MSIIESSVSMKHEIQELPKSRDALEYAGMNPLVTKHITSLEQSHPDKKKSYQLLLFKLLLTEPCSNLVIRIWSGYRRLSMAWPRLMVGSGQEAANKRHQQAKRQGSSPQVRHPGGYLSIFQLFPCAWVRIEKRLF